MKRAPLILLLLVLAAFGAGLYHLLQMRFNAGDVYPPYSSLRADPLGTKALYESLEALRPTHRHIRPLHKLSAHTNITLFFLGTKPEDLALHETEWNTLQTWIEHGGRLITAFVPTPNDRFSSGFAASNTNQIEELTRIHADQEWSVGFNFEKPNKDEDGYMILELAERVSPDTSLPRSLPLHTALYFELEDDAWTVLYQRTVNGTNLPVVIERKLGQGSIVFMADSYPFSNEAMFMNREPELIAWLAGGTGAMIFEESHLGVISTPGVASLARQYRLHAFFVALLILCGLFIWQQSVPFLPRLTTEDETLSAVAGKDAAAGFVHLLERHVAAKDLMPLCLEKWIAQVSEVRHIHPARLKEMQQLIEAENQLPARERDPVELYNQFARILDHRRPAQNKESAS